ncbi:o-succinylbenzoate synthase [Halobacillus litoralis]|uniref:o-succinylbenzoate synthase n=1 Tax=Halobacillus litoralis TaxID=45668 RepID=UPI001CFC79C6|nr:o-succinylbenzoate synthase [Halobacillus litoralis]
MNIRAVVLREIELSMKSPFVTHQGSLETRPLIIVEAHDAGGNIGYGEVTAFPAPFYTYETLTTAWYVLEQLLIPLLSTSSVHHPRDFAQLSEAVKGHPMAKAGLEGSLWDLYAKQRGVSLQSLIGGERTSVKAGAVLSLEDNLEGKLSVLKEEGYQRYKLKVEKGHERQMIETVQSLDPDLPIMIDANGQYEEKDIEGLYELDRYQMLMIEQPFAAGDFYLHQWLQKQMETPICLDESIMCFHDAVQAVQLDSCRVVNVKISRVGGLTAALNIHDYCQDHGVPVWCGGMVESGISKAHNLALASLPNFTIPGDLSSSERYFKRDLLTSGIKLEYGEIQVPQGPGIGVEVDDDYLHAITKKRYVANL